MVAKPETLKRFIFNSDYPTDKIVWLYEGQTTSPSQAGVTSSVDIDMVSILGSTAPIFVKGVFTVDDWETSYMSGVNRVTTDPYKNVTMGMSWWEWNDTQLHLDISSRTQYSVNKTVKYRLWGVQREDIDFAIDYSKNSTVTKNKLSFNTDNNYPRLYKDGVAKSGDVLQHDLGKIPYVDYWVTTSQNGFRTGWMQPTSGFFTNSPNAPTIKATDNTLTFTQGGGSDYWFYYRVYA